MQQRIPLLFIDNKRSLSRKTIESDTSRKKKGLSIVSPSKTKDVCSFKSAKNVEPIPKP